MSWDNCGNMHMKEILEDTVKLFLFLDVIWYRDYGDKVFILLRCRLKYGGQTAHDAHNLFS